MGDTSLDFSRACPARPVYGPFVPFVVLSCLAGFASGRSLYFDHIPTSPLAGQVCVYNAAAFVFRLIPAASAGSRATRPLPPGPRGSRTAEGRWTIHSRCMPAMAFYLGLVHPQPQAEIRSKILSYLQHLKKL